MRKLINDDRAVIQFIMTGILILVMSVMAINIVYPILNAGDNTAENNLRDKLGYTISGSTANNSSWAELNATTAARAAYKPVTNASLAVLAGTDTVMGLNPLAALVAVAAGILTLLMSAFIPREGTSI